MQNKPALVFRLKMYSDRKTFYTDVPSMERALSIARDAAAEAGVDGAAWPAEAVRLHEQNIHRLEETREIQYSLHLLWNSSTQ